MTVSIFIDSITTMESPALTLSPSFGAMLMTFPGRGEARVSFGAAISVGCGGAGPAVRRGLLKVRRSPPILRMTVRSSASSRVTVTSLSPNWATRTPGSSVWLSFRSEVLPSIESLNRSPDFATSIEYERSGPSSS